MSFVPETVIALGVFILSAVGAAGQMTASTPAYIGSAVCAGCHEDEATAWRGSHHQLAWTLPDEETVAGDFADASFAHNGETATFFRAGESFNVNLPGPDGVVRDYTVLGVIGTAPLQQYIVETEPGRLQALDIAWDDERDRW